MRNMKLSIFDRNVYIRSLKLNGSTFNAYFKRFDRCEMMKVSESYNEASGKKNTNTHTSNSGSERKNNIELNVTESRWYNVWFEHWKHIVVVVVEVSKK